MAVEHDNRVTQSLAARLIAWQKRHGRHDLPWQHKQGSAPDAYAVWLSEIMLQQTQVATVIPYYVRFLAQFPTVQALATASLDAVLILWSGLGYYARARNLHKAATLIVECHGGKIPADPDVVQTLPGIGRSTAAAVCVFAYGGRHAILDGNVKRVLARYCGVRGYPGDARVQAQLWRRAQALLPAYDNSEGKRTSKSSRSMVAYTQGLMDLGANVCTRRNPACGKCPLSADCIARLRGLTDRLPGKKPRAALPRRATKMLLMRCGEKILLEKRATDGIWGGLWSLPEVAQVSEARAAVKRYGARVLSSKALPALAHGFTHFNLTIEPLLLEVERSNQRVADVMWLTAQDAVSAAIPAPVRKIILAHLV